MVEILNEILKQGKEIPYNQLPEQDRMTNPIQFYFYSKAGRKFRHALSYIVMTANNPKSQKDLTIEEAMAYEYGRNETIIVSKVHSKDNPWQVFKEVR